MNACIVTTQMMLQPTELVIGTTWVMRFNLAAMREAFSIPDNIEPIEGLLTKKFSQAQKPVNNRANRHFIGFWDFVHKKYLHHNKVRRTPIQDLH
jgi:nitroreductase